MTSDNSKSHIDFLDLKIMKIKIQALLHSRFNLYLFIITLRHNNKIQEQGESQKICLNLK